MTTQYEVGDKVNVSGADDGLVEFVVESAEDRGADQLLILKDADGVTLKISSNYPLVTMSKIEVGIEQQ